MSKPTYRPLSMEVAFAWFFSWGFIGGVATGIGVAWVFGWFGV